MREVEDRLRSLDPARGHVDEPDETFLEGLLQQQRLDTAQVRRLKGQKRTWLLGGAFLAAASVLAVVAVDLQGTSAQPVYAVTPMKLAYSGVNRPAAEVLEEIAARTEKLPTGSGGEGTERFVQESWSLSTRIDGVQVTSAVIPERRTTWKKPDGSLKWVVESVKPRFQNAKQRETWEEAGAVGNTTQRYEGSSGPAAATDARGQEPPTDPAGMRRWLALGYESAGPGETFDSVSERFLTTRFSAAQRAALLRSLIGVQKIEYRGQVTDRAGRPGEAFSVDSGYGGLPTKHTLAFDSRTGDLRYYEEELTGNAGKLNVKTPAIIMYVTYQAE
ncbi:CU044_5270 family protein [Streptomyces albipurpureus]|uniref:CU044_5270 family protein n=1 Tax=Streptomyces albipurpureus TaxID=2897419 RepID=A0ABT0UQ17_9ACTN|nr:CU044_5270 family protein [Streptomyces sp. CWNU-1]MCM2390633.1 CU044_5270 family protein [Streptomyces sp. CWNU-1]